MKKVLYMFIFIVLCTTIYAEEQGYSSVPNKIFDIPVCVDGINLKVYPTIANQTYILLGCNTTNESINTWSCKCQKKIYLQIPNGTTNTFSITAEYYIKPLTNNLINDFNAKRIVTLNNYVITEKSPEQVKAEEEAVRQQDAKVLNFIISFIVIFFLILILICIHYFYLKPKLRKKWNMGDDDKLSILMIIRKVFARENISRKNLPGMKKEEPKKVFNTEAVKQPTDIKDEARRILERINK